MRPRRSAPAAFRATFRAGLWALVLLPSCGAADGARRPLVDTWPDGARKCEGVEVRVDGRWVKEGPATFYRADGSLAARGEYARGLETGSWTEWLEDGSRAEGAYREGERDGPWSYWHPNGKRQEQGAYAAGTRTGTWRWWYDDGPLRSEAEYRAGRLHGRVVGYHRDGSVDPEGSGAYEDGVKVGD